MIDPVHRRPTHLRLIAVVVASTLLVAACGKTAKTASSTTAAGGAASTAAAPAAGGATTAASTATTAPVASSGSATKLVETTPAGTKEVASIKWSLYRETSSLDPIFSFDYPENTVIAQLCENLLTQAPDGALKPGLAKLTQPDDTTLVFTLRDGVKFWNGDPVTADDVVFSLGRAKDPALGGFYPASFTRVDSITATSPTVVTIKLSKPDYWLLGEIGGTPGWIVQKKFVEAAGKDFGNPTGGTMCSGSYKLGPWKVGEALSIVRNDAYWDPSVKPLVKQIDFVAIADSNTLATALLSGDLTGSYQFTAVPTIDQIKASPDVTVTEGSGWNTQALIISSFKGAFGSKEIRQALSLALDRQKLIDAAYKGYASLPRSLSAPGTWGYGKDVFAAGYAALPELKPDAAKAKAMAEKAGVAGKTVTLGYIAEAEAGQAEANAYKTAGEAIGLKVELKAVSADQYINFFIDAKFREGVDGFFTTNYGDYADPASLLATLVIEGGSQNYTGYSNPKVTALMEEARTTADLNTRAKKMVDAQVLIMDDMPWIPTVFPTNLVLTRSNLTGAVASFAYMFAPWANQLGGK